MSNEKKKFNWKAVTQHHLFLPIVCLLVVLLVNVIKTPDFFVISMKGGVLYGYLVDVVNRASELVIVAIGMTLVTAASGGQEQSWRWRLRYAARYYPEDRCRQIR